LSRNKSMVGAAQAAVNSEQRLLIRSTLGILFCVLGCSPNVSSKLIRSSPEAQVLAEVYYARGLRSERMRDQGGARFYFNRAVDLDPLRSRGFYHLAKSYFAAGNRRFLHTRDEGRLKFTADYYSEAIELDSKFAAAYEGRGFVRLEQGLMKDVCQDFLTAASIDSEFFMNFDDTTWSTRNAEAAVACYKSQLEKRTEVAILWLKYGNACVAAGEFETALEAYGQATTVERPFHLALVARGMMYLQLGQLEAAEADLQRGVELLPEHPGAVELLARCRFMQTRFEEAHKLYTDSLTNRRINASTFIQRGLTSVQLGDWKSALSDFTSAHKLTPDAPFIFEFPGAPAVGSSSADGPSESVSNPATLFLLATERLRNDESSTAVEALDQCLHLAPDFALGWLVRGVIEEVRGNHDAALINFNQALAIKPELARAFNNRGNLYADRGQRSEAIADYKASSLADPRFAWPHRNLGLLLSEIDPDAALAAISRSLRLDPSLTEAALDRSRLYEAMGNDPAAKCDRYLAASN
jgi:tetratricopeptide (TPR) repeat protein